MWASWSDREKDGRSCWIQKVALSRSTGHNQYWPWVRGRIKVRSAGSMFALDAEVISDRGLINNHLWLFLLRETLFIINYFHLILNAGDLFWHKIYNYSTQQHILTDVYESLWAGENSHLKCLLTHTCRLDDRKSGEVLLNISWASQQNSIASST